MAGFHWWRTISCARTSCSKALYQTLPRRPPNIHRRWEGLASETTVYLCLMSFSRWRLPLLVCDWKTCSLSFYSFIVTCHSRFNIKGYLGTLLVIISRNVRGRATTSATTDLRRIWRCSYRDRNVKVSIVRGVVGLKVLSSPYSKSFLWLIYVLS